MKKNAFQLVPFLVLGLMLLVASCSEKNRFEIDTNKDRVHVKIQRFDKDLLSIDSTNLKSSVDSLYAHYPKFLPIFASEVLDTIASDTVAIRNMFYNFVTDPAFTQVNKKTLQTFADVSDIEKKISDAYTYLRFYFPEMRLPEIYFFVSGFNQSIIMTPGMIAIGADLYLGSDFPAYKELTYKYISDNMRRECLATDLVSALLSNTFRMDNEITLLDNMLLKGKVLYLMSVIMPTETQEGLMGYTTEQIKWCKAHERQIWATMIDKKHLFSPDLTLIYKYVNDAPFTSPISQESPGRVGSWLGWQIVQSYMRNNKEVSLHDMMMDTNYDRIIQKSDYRP